LANGFTDTYTHVSKLQTLPAPLLTYTLYKSLEQTKSSPSCSVFTNLCFVTNLQLPWSRRCSLVNTPHLNYQLKYSVISSQPPCQNSSFKWTVICNCPGCNISARTHRKHHYSAVACVFVAAETCLTSRYLETGCMITHIKNPLPQ
jgi:hypothetical protein